MGTAKPKAAGGPAVLQITWPREVVWEMRMRMRMRRYIRTYICMYMRMRYAGKCAGWRARRPIKAGNLLAPPADCACAWPAPEWSRFRFSSRRPRAGDRRTGTCAPRLPGPVRAGLQNTRAPATTGMRIHQQPPCMCDRTCQYRPYTHARARTPNINAPAYGPCELDFQSTLRPGMHLFPGLPMPLITRALGARGRAGPRGSCGKIALKPRPPS